jgi:formylglycine-generating enzyme required for sulfatase activity
MDGPALDRLEHYFHAALECDADARLAVLLAARDEDPRLEVELRRLLAADADASGAALDAPSPAIATAALDESTFEPAIGERIGPFVVVALLGEGGMGRVLLGRRDGVEFEQHVAIKVLRGVLAIPELRRRFEAERRILARLEHPGVARLIDGGTTERGVPWLAMQYVAGEPLDVFCDRTRATVRARVSLLREICEAVAHAHSRLLVHRDLKPSNVLVDRGGRPWLIDFGIAKLLDDEDGDALLTQTGMRLLTPRFASPEQVRGEPVTPASDVYSLGVMLHELLTGASPYGLDAGTTRARLERAVLEVEPRPASTCCGDVALAAARGTTPSRLARQLRGDLDRVLGKALEKEPTRRYPSARELLADLHAWLRGLPVSARGASPSYRIAKFVRRHPLASGAIFAASAGLAIALAVHLEAASRDRRHMASILRLEDLVKARRLLAEASEPAPPTPDRIAGLEDWLDRASDLLARRSIHAAALDDVASLSPTADGRIWLGGQLEELLAAFDALERPDPFGATVRGAEARLAALRELPKRSIDDHRAAWDAAIEDIARVEGIAISPQLGLVPLGRDPGSGRMEFVHVLSGAIPRRAAGGSLELGEEHGIVLAMLPGGLFAMGAQRADESAPGYDELARDDESPVHEVVLAPFFLGKHETTQAQWQRLCGETPSGYPAGTISGGGTTTSLHPVEQVSHAEAAPVLVRAGLALPTEAQWEYACRGGTTTRFAFGDDVRSLDGAANLADAFARDHGGGAGWAYEASLTDGHVIHAPVTFGRANPFGLVGMHGNVWEWTRDSFAPYTVTPREGDGLRSERAADKVARGGGFFNPPALLRSAHRWYSSPPDYHSHSLGIRVARPIDP